MHKRTNILFLSPFFHPEQISTGRYNTHLVEALVRAGHRVRVVASHPLYPDWKPRRSDARLSGVEIHRGGLFMRYPGSNVPRRILLELWFALHAWITVLRRRRDIDIVVAVFPPDMFLLALQPILPRTARKVGVVHDIQGVMAKTNSGLLRRVASYVMRAVERRTFKACDTLICLSDSMRRHLIADYGIDPERCPVHYPFVTIPERLGQGGSELEALFPAGYRHIVYSGALGEKQIPRELLGFFQRLCEARADLICHLFSSGPLFEALRREVAAKPNPRVRFHSLVPDDLLTSLYGHSAVQVIPQASGTGAGAFPSKLPNLMAAGVPVFAICDADSELARVMDETGIGAHAAPDDPGSWVSSLEALLDGLATRPHEALARSAAPYVDAHFNVDRLVEAIVPPTSAAAPAARVAESP